jgi:hypothetical protein
VGAIKNAVSYLKDVEAQCPVTHWRQLCWHRTFLLAVSVRKAGGGQQSAYHWDLFRLGLCIQLNVMSLPA